MRTANYSDLRQNLKTYIDSVIEDSDTVIGAARKTSGPAGSNQPGRDVDE